jgi:transglutaminase-like putative cysteine protease
MKHGEDFQAYLTPTSIIDSDHPDVEAFARRTCGDSIDTAERAVKLYLAVRDSVRYDPYMPFHLPEHYRASSVLRRGRGFCIPKASLLCACARVMGIPSRLGFANVRNHLATRQLLEFLGVNLFVFHAFVEMHLGGKWVKATPAFNRELCERHRVPPLEFDGHEDSVFQPYNLENQKYMEYEVFLGSYADVPVVEIVSAWEATYGKERVSGWVRHFSGSDGRFESSFETEEVMQA